MLTNTRDELQNATVHLNSLSAEFGNIKCLQDEYIGGCSSFLIDDYK